MTRPRPNGAGGGGAVALTLVRRDAAKTEPGRPRARDGQPAATRLAPQTQDPLRRGSPCRDDRDELGRLARRREPVGEVRGTGGGAGRAAGSRGRQAESAERR